jgi:hypothetical protein
MTQPIVNARSAAIRQLPLGRGGLLVLGVVLGFITIGSVWVWKLRNPDELPDVGDPFNGAAARRPIVMAEDDNAYVLYTEATRRLPEWPAAFSTIDFGSLTWSNANADVRAFVESIWPALELWREGSNRPGAIYHQPSGLAWDTVLPVVQDVGTLSRLAGLEGSRLEDAGAMERAWLWYRAMLRSSRHIGMHGVLVERVFGARQHELAAGRIIHWASDARVDARLLRQALADTLDADAMTAPLSNALKLEYLMFVRDLSELRVTVKDIPLPAKRYAWVENVVATTVGKPRMQRIRLRAINDVERSRRAARILFANWLAQVDKPIAERAPIAIHKPTLIYAPDPTAPAAARAVNPEVLDKAISHTAFAHQVLRPDDPSRGGSSLADAPWEGDGQLAKESRRRAVLIVILAAELFRREHGQLPATAGALVGPYLKVLPAGIKHDDPIPTGLD